ncbi:hypothetical protein ACFLY3_04220 [Chloroflexota bacterium]
MNHVARKLKDIQPGIPASPVNDELQELRQKRDIVKLQKEITELEAIKEKLPERVTTLEKAVLDLRTLINDSVDTTFFNSLVYAGVGRKEAEELADGWTDRIDKKIKR